MEILVVSLSGFADDESPIQTTERFAGERIGLRVDGDGFKLAVFGDFFAVQTAILVAVEQGLDPNNGDGAAMVQANAFIIDDAAKMEIGRKYVMGAENHIYVDEYPNSYVVRVS